MQRETTNRISCKVYKPREEQKYNSYVATDVIWFIILNEIDKIRSTKNQPHLYILDRLDDKAFSRKQLQVLPPDAADIVINR